MSGFNGKAFLLGIQHLDAQSRELFDRHGHAINGRFAFVEQIVNDAMLRLAGSEYHSDPYRIDRNR